MGVLTLKRVVLFVVAVSIGTSAIAKNPSPRTQARLAYEPPRNTAVLFGGRGPLDSATAVSHASNETWTWTGGRWIQRFPATTPPARSAQSMVYDSNRDRVVMFGGRQEAANRDEDPTSLADTWVWKNDNWTRIEVTGPTARQLAGMAYDAKRDRIVLFGGNEILENGNASALYDTWEFDGTNWTEVKRDEPKLSKPLLAYDEVDQTVYLIGLTEAVAPVMYRFDAEAHNWVLVTNTAASLPTCVNEGHFIYQKHRQALAFFGGVCLSGTPQQDESWEFDRAQSKWTKVAGTNVPRGIGQASSYDPLRGHIVTFGGTSAFGATVGSATTFLRDGRWTGTFSNTSPAARSLPAFTTDPKTNTIWMFGGLDEYSDGFYGEFWGYRGNQWFMLNAADAPVAGCETPLSVYDTDRSRLVVLCSGSLLFEFDGTTWKSMGDINPRPSARRFAHAVYDQKLKKVLVFGGYNTSNYRNDTWAWDGAAAKWSEIKVDNKNRPPHRGLAMMWYDPLQQKTLLYGGLGRGSVDEKITRYDDMWEFDGTRWTKMSPQQTPGQRFGAQIGVNPTTGRLLLFGGLRSQALDEDSITQFFDNDTWEWNGLGNAWTKLEPATRPNARENGGMAWDPYTNQLVIFGGYANGFFYSDMWGWNGENWVPRPELGVRGRPTRH